MSKGLDTWREKRDYFQQQEAITADPDQKFALHKKIEEATAKIAELEAVAARSSPVSSGHFQHDISRILKYAPAELIGREAETQLIDAAWAKVQGGESNRPRVLTFVALGGEGKTSLVTRWAADLSAQNWPGCAAAFAWSFYSQGTRDQSAASSDVFLKAALAFFGGDDKDQAFADSPAGAFEKGQRLARIVGERKNLLILDGLEPLQYAPTSPTPGELKDQCLVALLKGLAQYNRGLCLVTTRYSLPDLNAFRQTTAPEVALHRLSRAAGVELLKKLGVCGAAQELETLVEDVKGHALTLTLLGGFLHRAFGGDIRKRDCVKFEKADARIDGGHALRTMAAYEQWLLRDGGEEGQREVAVLRLLGLFDRPADAACLAALRREPIAGLTEPLDGLADDDWAFCLSGLEAARLLTVNRDATGALIALDTHPHLRAYFAQQLCEKNAAAWRAAHRRLYEHLCASTPDRDAPTLEDLQPLYQAVAHGCLAGLQQAAREKVYRDRILRGTGSDGFYSVHKLGAFGSDLGAVACFFESPWRRVSPALSEPAQAWLLNEAAIRLHALGRLTEALEPMRVSGEMDVKVEAWKGAAISYSNLSGLELTLGEVAAAVADAARSVTHADRSGDTFQRMSKRTTHADALHQAGRRDEAEVLFREAGRIQVERRPAYPLLYSLWGFRYCDLLLATAERAAWRTVLPASAGVGGEGLAEACRIVSERAAKVFEWRIPDDSLLDIALDHLSLGRAALYEAILTAADVGRARSDVERAVAGLRRAGINDYLVRGLLTRAWLRHLLSLRSGPDSAQADLDEAWDIAERGPMRLFLADIHLYRARLFHAATPYPWDSPQADLAAARKLIEQCGYGRRLEELADAEAALGCA